MDCMLYLYKAFINPLVIHYLPSLKHSTSDSPAIIRMENIQNRINLTKEGGTCLWRW